MYYAAAFPAALLFVFVPHQKVHTIRHLGLLDSLGAGISYSLFSVLACVTCLVLGIWRLEQ
jgi:hypothetical protein